MKITMDGEYAFEDAPTEKVRILCVDAPGKWPVVGLLPTHAAFFRNLDGTFMDLERLIPLQRKPREFWVNVYPTSDAGITLPVFHADQEEAKAGCLGAGGTIHVREVLE